jgi:hypothetical protein
LYLFCRKPVKITRKLVNAGVLLEITVPDHMILANDPCYSFAGDGVLQLSLVFSDAAGREAVRLAAVAAHADGSTVKAQAPAISDTVLYTTPVAAA